MMFMGAGCTEHVENMLLCIAWCGSSLAMDSGFDDFVFMGGRYCYKSYSEFRFFVESFFKSGMFGTFRKRPALQGR